MATGLEAELKTYEEHKPELLARARGQYVLIKGSQVVETFTSEEDALKRGYQDFGNQPFLVKQIADVEVPANFTSFLVAV
jgi:hypothetical protein